MVASAAHIVSSMILFNDNDDLEQGLTTDSLSQAYLIVTAVKGLFVVRFLSDVIGFSIDYFEFIS